MLMLYQTTKPAIIIYVGGNIDEDKLRQVGFGIEEEGIPFLRENVSGQNSETLVHLAHQAATASPLSVGLAIDDRDLVLHYRNLQKDQFLYRIRDYMTQPYLVLRILGINAARLVKGNPMIKHEVLEQSF